MHTHLPCDIPTQAHLLVDLLRQLPRRRQHQRHRPVAVPQRRLVEAELDHGDRKARRLAAAGLRAAEDVAAAERYGDALGLDGRGGLVLVGGDVGEDVLVQVLFHGGGG